MGDIAARLKTVRDRDGCGSVVVYAGNPASFATLHYSYASSFGRALGPAKIFNALHVDTGAKNLAQELLFGSPVHWTFPDLAERSEEHTSELQSLMRISYAVFCLKKKNIITYYLNLFYHTTN